MSPDDLPKWLNLGPKVFAAVFVASAVALLLPAPVIAFLGLAQYAATYRGYVSLAALVSGMLLLVELVVIGGRKYSMRSKHSARLASLTEQEKVFLRPYFEARNRSGKVFIEHPQALELERAGVIKRFPELATSLKVIPFTIEEWAWKALTEKPALLEGSKAAS
jgi:hypothetical protein